MKQQYKHRQKQGGFTLVELIVVIAIIGILAVLVVPSVSGYVQKAQATTCQRNIQSAAQMLDQVVAQDMGSYDDAALNKLLGDIIDNNGGYFSKPVKCPSGGTYTYSASWAANGSLQCTITCSKHEGIEGSKTVAQKVDKSSSVYMEEVLKLLGRKDLTKEEKKYLAGLLGNDGDNCTYVSNSRLRDKIIQEYGGEWPELEKDIASKLAVPVTEKLYVQPYVSTKGENSYGGTLIYASMSSGKSGKQPWEAYAIYNSNDNKWYKPAADNIYVKGNTYNVDRLRNTEYDDTVDSILASLSDPTQWTPIN